LSVSNVQPEQPSGVLGPCMKWRTISCERPSNSSASVFVPSLVSKRYSFSTRHPRQRLTLARERPLRRVSSFADDCGFHQRMPKPHR
jgi:hypothetical protein